MKRIFDRAVALALSRTAKDTYVLSVGNIAAAVLAIAFTIFAARALGPEGFGIIGAAISFIVIVEAIGDLGLGSALFRFGSSGNTLRVVFLLRVATAVFVLVVLAAFSGVLSRVVFGLDQPVLVVLAGLAIFGYLLLDFQVTSFQARHRWFLSATFIVLTNTVRIGFLFLLIAAGRISVVGVLAVFAASPIFSFLLTLLWQRTLPTVAEGDGGIIGKVVPFSGWLGVNRVASAAAGRMDAILLLALSGAYSAGIFSAAKQLTIGVPLVVGSIATVMALRFASARGRYLVAFFKKTVWLSLLLAIFLVVGTLAAPLVIKLFGPAYQEATGVFQVLLLAHVPFVLSMPAVNVLIYAFGKTRIVALAALMQLLLVYLGNRLLIPRLDALAPALMIGVANLAVAFVVYAAALQRLRK